MITFDVVKLKAVDIYILIWALFHIGSFFGVGGITFLLPVLIIWSFYDMISLHIKSRLTSFVAVYDIMVVMFTLYGVLFFIQSNNFTAPQFRDIANSAYLIKVLPSLLPFYTMYRNTIKGDYGIDRIRIWAGLFIVVTILDYFMQLRGAFSQHVDAEEVVNNGSYLILGLFPIITLFKRKTVQVVSVIACLYLIILALKRGPIIIAAVCILYYLYKTIRYSNNKGWLLVLILIAFAAFYHFLSAFFMSSDLLQTRLQLTMEGYTSGRDDIVASLIDAFANADFFNKLFGHGAYGTISLVGRLAHNDWVQILIDQGIIGVIIHAMFCYQLIRQWIKTPSWDNARIAVGLFVIIYLFTSVFSMAFDRIPLAEMVVLAFFVAKNDSNPELLRR